MGSTTTPSGITGEPEHVLLRRIAELESQRAELDEARRLQGGASRVLERLATGASLDEVLRTLIETIESVSPDMIGSVLMLDESGRHLRLGVAPGLPASYNEAIDGVAIGPAVGSCGTCAYTGERVIVSDVATHPYWSAFKDVALNAGLRACWSHPIASSTGRILGTFAMYYREPRRPAERDLELIQFAAHLAGVAIERSRTEAALRSSEQRLRALVDGAPICIHEIDLEGRLVLMNATGLRILGVESMQDIADMPYLDCVAEGDRARVEALLQDALRGRSARFEFNAILRQRDNSERTFESSFVPIRDAEGAVVRIMGVSQDITERRETERRQVGMLRELDHRVKNNLASVISIVQQSAERAGTVEECEATLTGRVRAMAVAHEMLAAARWGDVQLRVMLERVLAAYGGDERNRVGLTGPEVLLPDGIATPVCMAVHELAVNAAKYGALSTPSGRVDVSWSLPDGPADVLRLSWKESRGPSVSPPNENGRGIMIIEGMIAYQLHGTVDMQFEPGGVSCTLTVPLVRAETSAPGCQR